MAAGLLLLSTFLGAAGAGTVQGLPRPAGEHSRNPPSNSRGESLYDASAVESWSVVPALPSSGDRVRQPYNSFMPTLSNEHHIDIPVNNAVMQNVIQTEPRKNPLFLMNKLGLNDFQLRDKRRISGSFPGLNNINDRRTKTQLKKPDMSKDSELNNVIAKMMSGDTVGNIHDLFHSEFPNPIMGTDFVLINRLQPPTRPKTRSNQDPIQPTLVRTAKTNGIISGIHTSSSLSKSLTNRFVDGYERSSKTKKRSGIVPEPAKVDGELNLDTFFSPLTRGSTTAAPFTLDSFADYYYYDYEYDTLNQTESLTTNNSTQPIDPVTTPTPIIVSTEATTTTTTTTTTTPSIIETSSTDKSKMSEINNQSTEKFIPQMKQTTPDLQSKEDEEDTDHHYSEEQESSESDDDSEMDD